MELSICLSIVGALATVGGKLYCLVQEIEYAENCLGDLIDNIKNTEVQLNTIQEYLTRAELSDAQKARCDYHLRDTEIRANKFVNSIESIVLKLNDKSLKKVKQKLKLVNGELEGLRYQIDKIDRNLSAIRQQLMIGIALDERQERRIATAKVAEKLDTIEANTTPTDARRLRKQYRAYAQELMMDDYAMPPPYSPPSASIPQQSFYTPPVPVPVPVPFPFPVPVPVPVSASSDSSFWPVKPPMPQAPYAYPGQEKMPTIVTRAAFSSEPEEKIPWTPPTPQSPPIPQKPQNYTSKAYEDGLMVVSSEEIPPSNFQKSQQSQLRSRQSYWDWSTYQDLNQDYY